MSVSLKLQLQRELRNNKQIISTKWNNFLEAKEQATLSDCMKLTAREEICDELEKNVSRSKK